MVKRGDLAQKQQFAQLADIKNHMKVLRNSRPPPTWELKLHCRTELMQLQSDKDDMEDQMNLVIDEQAGKISKLEQTLSELLGQNRIVPQSLIKNRVQP